jgi:ferritin-like metal-binding protein YciE
MLLDNFSDLFQRGLEYAWDIEHLLLRQLPRIHNAASSQDLKQNIDLRLTETKRHVHALEQIFARLDRSPAAEKSEPIRIIVDECDRIIGHLSPSPLLDAALIFTTNQIEHYQIGLYRSLSGFAKALGLSEVVDALEEILRDEKDAIDQLMLLSEGTINAAASGFHNKPPFALI